MFGVAHEPSLTRLGITLVGPTRADVSPAAESTMWKESTQMRVSVSMVTYNHERQIAQAIESVLLQEHDDFDLELVIGEDCSTDGTLSIVRDFAQRYPEIIRVISGPENVGAQRNVARVLENCTGDYLALLDGDDYWTSPHKLRTQVEFLETNKDCALCFHNVQVVDEAGGVIEVPDMSSMALRTRLEDLLIGNYISSCSVMYRWGLVSELPDWWNDMQMADFPLSVMHAQFGSIGYIDEAMAAYRRHPGGVFSVQKPLRQMRAFMEVLRALDGLLDRRYHRVIKRSLRRLRLNIIATRVFEAVPALRPLLGRLKPFVRRIYKPAA